MARATSGRRATATTAAVISTILLAWMALGYLGSIGPLLSYQRRSTSSVDDCRLSLFADDGRVLALWWAAPLATGEAPSPQQGLHLHARLHWIGRPTTGNWLWGFAARSAGSAGRFHMVAASCPIWLVSLPCLVAPVFWLRGRSRRDPAGFPIAASV